MSTAPNRLPRGCTHLLGRLSGTIAVFDDHEAGIAIAARYDHAVALHGGLLVAPRLGRAQAEATDAADAVGGAVIEWRQA